MARERTVESRLKSRIEEVGGACEKFTGTVRGEPDRICSFPNKYHCLVETKWETGVTPEPHQLRRHAWWRTRGMDVWVVCNDHDIDTVLFHASALQSARLSVGGGPVPGGAPARDAGGRPWAGENGDFSAGAGYAEAGRVELLPCVGPSTEAGRGRCLVRGER